MRSTTPDILGDVSQETNEDVVASVMGRPPVGSAYDAGLAVMIPLNLLHDNPYQPRQLYTGIDELAENIRLNGLLQPPVARRGYGHLELAFGHRRLRAYKLLHEKFGNDWAKMPVVVRQLSDDEMARQAWSENHNREDVSAVEEARLFQRMMDDFGLTQQEIAHDIGKSRSAVANTLRLLQLPAEAQAMIDAGQITERHGRELLRLAGVPRWQMAFIGNLVAEIKNGDASTVNDLKRRIDAHIRVNGILMPSEPLTSKDNFNDPRLYNPPVWGWEYSPKSPDVVGPCTGCDQLVQFGGDPAPRCTNRTCHSAKLRLWTEKERERQKEAALAAAKALPAATPAPAQRPPAAAPASEPATGADGLEFSRMDQYNLRIFGTDDAPAGLLEHGFCGKGKCECFKLKLLDESRAVNAKYLGPDRENAPRVVYICENWSRLHAQRNRLQEIEQPEEAQKRKDEIRAKSDTTKAAKEQLRQLWSQLTVEDLANNTFMMRRLAYNTGVKAVGDPGEIWERLFWKIAESQCKRSTWEADDRFDTWDLDRVQKFVADLQATPQPGPGDSQKTNWQEGWDDEDEGTWLLILAAPIPVDPETIDLPRVLLRAIETTDDKTVRGALWRRYNQLINEGDTDATSN